MFLLDFMSFLKHLYPSKLDLDSVLGPVLSVGGKTMGTVLRDTGSSYAADGGRVFPFQLLLGLFFAVHGGGKHSPSLLYRGDPRTATSMGICSCP